MTGIVKKEMTGFEKGVLHGHIEGVRSERERMTQVIYWLAGVYQVNFNKLSPTKIDWGKEPKWKQKAYMQFNTVQGLRQRMLVDWLSKQDIDKELWSGAMETLEETKDEALTPTDVTDKD
jgi:hypothetical protein